MCLKPEHLSRECVTDNPGPGRDLLVGVGDRPGRIADLVEAFGLTPDLEQRGVDLGEVRLSFRDGPPVGHHERARERIGGLEVQVGGRILGVPDRDDVLAMASDGLEIGRGMALREDEQSDLSVTILPCNVEFLERSRDVVAVRGLGLDHDTLVRRGLSRPSCTTISPTLLLRILPVVVPHGVGISPKRATSAPRTLHTASSKSPPCRVERAASCFRACRAASAERTSVWKLVWSLARRSMIPLSSRCRRLSDEPASSRLNCRVMPCCAASTCATSRESADAGSSSENCLPRASTLRSKSSRRRP